MNLMLVFSVFVSFVVALVGLPKWIKKCRQVGLEWSDMNKFEKRKVAASGGVVVVMAFVLGVMSYIALRTFIFGGDGVNVEIFALISVILILSIVGLVDDLLGWQHGGLSAKFRVFLAMISAVPLVVINAGVSEMNFPFVGLVDLGLVYPLILIPLGVAGATTTYNFLAGFNGLEAGQGILILSFLSVVSYSTGNAWLSVIGAIMVTALIVFYFYNRFPARVFPGDILTYAIGALIAGMAILGNFEKIAVFIFIPYIIETFLKARGKLKKQSFGKVKLDGSLDLPYDKIYGLTHFSIFVLKKFKKKVYEKDVVRFIFIVQIIFILLAIVLFGIGK